MGDGKKVFIPLAIGILDKHHVREIGEAIWVYLWLINRTTKEVESLSGKLGMVLNGRPVPSGTIAEELGLLPRTVRSHLQRLAEKSYIDIQSKGGGGQVIAVCKSKKWIQRKPQPSSQPSQQPSPKRSPARPLNAIERLFMNDDDDD